MLGFLRLWFGLLVRCFRSHRSLLVENLALRQQLIVLKRRHPKPTLEYHDKLFWGFARRFWSAWKRSLIVVTPDTVVRWHRAGFRLYWAGLSRPRPASGRQRISLALRDLIFRMAAENPTWGAPRIHGELRMLGFAISERTVSRWVRRAPRKTFWKLFDAKLYNPGDDHSPRISEIEEHNVCEATGPDRIDTTDVISCGRDFVGRRILDAHRTFRQGHPRRTGNVQRLPGTPLKV